jgi:hypothetical protein
LQIFVAGSIIYRVGHFPTFAIQPDAVLPCFSKRSLVRRLFEISMTLREKAGATTARHQ